MRNGDGGEFCLENVGDGGAVPDMWKNAGLVGDVGVLGWLIGADFGRGFCVVLVVRCVASFAVENEEY
jgi:hypothetical protein